jgi:hypothetical protein
MYDFPAELIILQVSKKLLLKFVMVNTVSQESPLKILEIDLGSLSWIIGTYIKHNLFSKCYGLTSIVKNHIHILET